MKNKVLFTLLIALSFMTPAQAQSIKGNIYECNNNISGAKSFISKLKMDYSTKDFLDTFEESIDLHITLNFTSETQVKIKYEFMLNQQKAKSSMDWMSRRVCSQEIKKISKQLKKPIIYSYRLDNDIIILENGNRLIWDRDNDMLTSGDDQFVPFYRSNNK